MSLEFYMSLAGILMSLLALYLHALNAWRNRVSLRVTQDDAREAWAFPFVMYEPYDCLFFGLRIENRAKTDVSVSEIVLYASDGTAFRPEPFHVVDFHNPNGISLYERDDTSRFWMLDLQSDNILNNLRIPGHGCVSGFAVFLHGPVLSSQVQHFKLKVRTPTKSYRVKVKVSKLPDTLRPYHESKSGQPAQRI